MSSDLRATLNIGFWAEETSAGPALVEWVLRSASRFLHLYFCALSLTFSRDKQFLTAASIL
ncbi:MAG: hypothetical protein CBE00_07960 [Planctomycetaceae bacterium TMED240]|nr:MAG: hypothetical protein CBE00_07960 [Planctomycetaceae bacterium TMED240]